MIAQLNSMKLQDKIYVQAITETAGEIMAGHEMPALPASIMIVRGSRSRAPESVRLSRKVWIEQSRGISAVVEGHGSVEVRIKPQ